MRVDHIGYAVQDMARAVAALEPLGWEFGEPVKDPDRGVLISFGKLVGGGSPIELVAPTGVGSPVDGVLAKAGPTPYHICYACEDLDVEMKALRQDRWRVAVPPAPAVAFGGRRVCFLYHLHAGLIELVEE